MCSKIPVDRQTCLKRVQTSVHTQKYQPIGADIQKPPRTNTCDRSDMYGEGYVRIPENCSSELHLHITALTPRSRVLLEKLIIP